jgi:hypothetical protein
MFMRDPVKAYGEGESSASLVPSMALVRTGIIPLRQFAAVKLKVANGAAV